ncbi:MAG: N-acetylglucosamine-6-phosphate deacetylase [Anaerorhabdus sp.]
MIIQSKQVWVSGTFIEAQIEIQEGTITSVYPYGHRRTDIDYGELRIIPGMIDIHCHGGIGFDTNDATPDGLREWAKSLLPEGITSFCPTTVTQSEEVLSKALKNVAQVVDEGDFGGAEIIGVHFEGPYLNKKNKGAQPEEYILLPNVEQFKQYQKDAKGLIKIMTMACELDENHELTRYAADSGVNVSMGHSAITFEEACIAVANGATGITHTFNGMNGLHHRAPSLVGAAMRLSDTYAEIICDGNHVSWAAIYALVMAKGDGHCIMIDDALCGKGCNPGKYMLGGHDIEIRDNGSAYLAGTDSLAGGTLKFNKGLQNLVEKAGIPLGWAINMVTINPARYLRIDEYKGKIMAGYDADLAILDRDYEIVDVYKGGKRVEKVG